MRDEIQLYRDNEIRPFGVNPASPERHASYAAKLGLPFPLLSDHDLAISRSSHSTPAHAQSRATAGLSAAARAVPV